MANVSMHYESKFTLMNGCISETYAPTKLEAHVTAYREDKLGRAISSLLSLSFPK
jgi:hypothetical protein